MQKSLTTDITDGTEWRVVSCASNLRLTARRDPPPADRLRALQRSGVLEGGRPRPPLSCPTTCWLLFPKDFLFRFCIALGSVLDANGLRHSV